MDFTKYLTKTNFSTLSSKENKYIVIHYTANNGDTAMNNAKYFYEEYRGASAHYFVDENEIVQVVLDENSAWHCGATSYVHNICRNVNSIGIEMCSRIDSSGQYYIKDEVVEKTTELTKYLMEKYNIPVENVLRHYDVTGKICPAPMVNNTVLWANFKTDLMKVEETIMEQTLSDFAKDGYNYVIENNISDGTRPQDNVTREELWTMIERMSKINN